MAITYYEFKDEKSNKFWEIEVKGKTVTVRYGKIGTDGQAKIKKLSSPADARAHAAKVTAEKTKKGYKKAKRPVSSKAKVAGAKKKASQPKKEKKVLAPRESKKGTLSLSPSVRFINCRKSINLNQFTMIADDAAEVLSKVEL